MNACSRRLVDRQFEFNSRKSSLGSWNQSERAAAQALHMRGIACLDQRRQLEQPRLKAAAEGKSRGPLFLADNRAY